MLAIFVVSALCFLIGLLLTLCARLLATEKHSVAEQINALLPQTQCAQCGYPGCRPYALAIEQGEAPINQCPPGGDTLIRDLASLLDKPVIALNTDFGEHKSAAIAFIREDECIGCTLCIAACPVDAIVGAGKFMHTVISDECTGCELCLPPCPVDCIDMIWHWQFKTYRYRNVWYTHLEAINLHHYVHW